LTIPSFQVRVLAIAAAVFGPWCPASAKMSDVANVHRASTAFAPDRRDRRLNQRQLGIHQITRRSQASPHSGAALFFHDGVDGLVRSKSFYRKLTDEMAGAYA
jgi:hypothetical protein